MEYIGKIRKYRNSIILSFNERGDNFSLNVPHHSKWIEIINFLRKRGFSIGENPSYKKHYNILSKYHKIGYKKDVACLLEIQSSNIEVKFGNIKNLWTGIAQDFWSDPSDNRYTKLSYLENIAVKLEIHRLFGLCQKFNLEYKKEESEMSPEEYIINSCNNNTHIHGKITCLDDIRLSIKEDSYDYRQNSDDKNKKKIICGETKYFYSYRTGRLTCGIAWHHINNMWWVLFGGEMHNMASFELFERIPIAPLLFRIIPRASYAALRLLTAAFKPFSLLSPVRMFFPLASLTVTLLSFR